LAGEHAVSVEEGELVVRLTYQPDEDLAEHLRSEALEGWTRTTSITFITTRSGSTSGALAVLHRFEHPVRHDDDYWNMEEAEMQRRHILFPEEDGDSYVGSMLDVVGAGGAAR
jgi:hypothetical protein